jgi:hypothetical protein
MLRRTKKRLGFDRIIISKHMTSDEYKEIKDGYFLIMLNNTLEELWQTRLSNDQRAHWSESKLEFTTTLLYVRAMTRNCTNCEKSSDREGFSKWVRRFKYGHALKGNHFLCNDCLLDKKEGHFRKDFRRIGEISGDELIVYYTPGSTKWGSITARLIDNQLRGNYNFAKHSSSRKFIRKVLNSANTDPRVIHTDTPYSIAEARKLCGMHY